MQAVVTGSTGISSLGSGIVKRNLHASLTPINNQQDFLNSGLQTYTTTNFNEGQALYLSAASLVSQ